MTAEEFYEWAGSCARDLEALELRRDSLRLPRSKGDGAASTGGTGDPTASAAMAAMADEPAILAGIERCKEVLRLEAQVTTKIGRALGPMAALAMQLHYRDGHGWEPIAFELHVSQSSLMRLRRRVMEWVDAEGLVASYGRRS